MSSINEPLDSYPAKEEDNKISPQEKIHYLKEIIKSTQTAMLTTRSPDGQLYSRAMNPIAPDSDTQLTLAFFANNVTHKFEEIETDPNVNVSFCNPSTTAWASFSGKAKIVQDREFIKKHWSYKTSAWFGDLGDGTHKGDFKDPRVSIIEVIPDEIHFWNPTKGKVGRGVEIAVASVTGKTPGLGELLTITKDEVQLTRGLEVKN